MKAITHVPNSLRSAGRDLRLSLGHRLEDLTHEPFIRAWSAVAYLFPGLHPDGFDDSDSGWPRVLKPFAVEAWRRAETGELADEELYPSDAQWLGLFDRMTQHTDDEIARRTQLSADHGERFHG